MIEAIGDHEGNGLTVVPDAIVLQRQEALHDATCWNHGTALERQGVSMGQDPQHTRHRPRRGKIDLSDAPRRHGALDDHGMDDAYQIVFEGVVGLPGNFLDAISARDATTEIRSVALRRFRIGDSHQMIPPTVSSARATTRGAKWILKRFSP